LAVLVCAAESLTATASATASALAVGVPLISPVAALSVRPAGSAPLTSSQVYGTVPPEAVSIEL
jgi:hypothetical protein